MVNHLESLVYIYMLYMINKYSDTLRSETNYSVLVYTRALLQLAAAFCRKPLEKGKTFARFFTSKLPPPSSDAVVVVVYTRETIIAVVHTARTYTLATPRAGRIRTNIVNTAQDRNDFAVQAHAFRTYSCAPTH